MAKIEHLVKDIEGVFAYPKDLEPALSKRFGEQLAATIARRLSPQEPRKPSLRMSNLGTKCARKLFYEIISPPGNEEQLLPNVKLKFLYGDLLEELLLFLAEVAGHKVEGRQTELNLFGVVGHRDAVIDGTTVDVKSASTYSFNKFKEHLTHDKDDFGYIDQLLGYLEAGTDDPLVIDKERAAFLVIDKTLGHICLDFHEREKDLDFDVLISMRRRQIAQDTPPERHYQDEPTGAYGNRVLGVACGYCSFKRTCWPNLRTYLYSNKPQHFTVVRREPKVPLLGTE